MRLKEIKPGMVIHCKNDEEKKALLEEAERLGYLWTDKSCPTDFQAFEQTGMTIHFYDSGLIAWSDKKKGATEFSDLIFPELTAEEVVPILTEICNIYNGNEDCEGCPLNGLEHICNGNECPFTFKDYKQVIEICEQWKDEHKKKEPEIEWVYRVFGEENYGEKFFHTEKEAIKRCEELAKSQKTKQYARYERICRVKAVE